jgi:hypothetical protein
MGRLPCRLIWGGKNTAKLKEELDTMDLSAKTFKG